MGITYYDTGTATLSVGSKTMTGQGTLWAGWVKPGDQVMPEEGTNNVVDVVVSNTEITLLKPYRGVAQVARPYTIMRTPDVVFTESLARQVLQKISDSTLVALAGLPSAARKGFRLGPTLSAETFDLSDAALTLLDDPDITSMRSTLDLNNQASLTDTTANRLLKVGSFGIGKMSFLGSPNLNAIAAPGRYYCSSPTNNPAGTGNGWLEVYDLDASYQFQTYFDVSTGNSFTRLKSAGTFQAWKPVIPSILTNSNGSCMRYGNGVQKCWGIVGPRTIAVTNSGTTSGVYFSSVFSVNFPISFSATPSFQVSCAGNLMWGTPNTVAASSATYLILAASAEPSRAATDMWEAVGFY